MNNTIKYSLIACASLLFTACDLIQPGEIESPNIDENTFLQTPNAMQTWVTGTKKSLAQTVSKFCLHTEIISDNYFNNYTRESKVFDIPQLMDTDPDIEELQRCVSNLRESADYGLNVVSKHDKQVTQEHLFTLFYIKAYSFILAGENFVALPIETGGEIKEWKDQLKLALPVLDSAMNRADSVQQKALVHTLKARVYYRLGEKNQAIAEARASLNLSKQLLWQVTFDGLNGIANLMQDDIWKTMYQPLPRLDFLDPKYFQLKSTDECPINIAKAEENHLIVAEAMLSQGEIEQCKQELKLLLELVSERKVQQGLADHLEGRYNGGFWHYPDSSAYEVAASPQDPYRKGLVLDRKAPHLIDIPYISGTSVTLDMINDCKQTEELLELVYLMRQEIFIAEGRRMNDLGIKLPICQVEVGHRAEAQPYRRAFIPPFIPLDRGMDAFDLDVKNHRVTIKYNMNKIIVANRNTPWVAPFVHD